MGIKENILAAMQYKSLFSEKRVKNIENLERLLNQVINFDLGRNKIDNQSAEKLADALERNQTLINLYLNFNQIGNQGATAIATALERNQTLISLDLSGNQIGDQGVVAIAQALRKNHTLISLNLYSNQINATGAAAIADALKKNRTLMRFSLWGNQISDQGAMAIATTLERNQTLTSFYLNFNKIGNQGAKAIATALEKNKTLISLDLSGNQINIAGAAAIADALKRNRTLMKFSLWGNQIGAQGAIAMATALESNQTLISLDLKGNKIGTQGAIAIATALGRNKTLISLNLSNNQIDDQAQKKIDGLIQRNCKFRDQCIDALKQNKVQQAQELLQQGISPNSVLLKLADVDNIQQEPIQQLFQLAQCSNLPIFREIILTAMDLAKNKNCNEAVNFLQQILQNPQFDTQSIQAEQNQEKKEEKSPEKLLLIQENEEQVNVEMGEEKAKKESEKQEWTQIDCESLLKEAEERALKRIRAEMSEKESKQQEAERKERENHIPTPPPFNWNWVRIENEKFRKQREERDRARRQQEEREKHLKQREAMEKERKKIRKQQEETKGDKVSEIVEALKPTHAGNIIRMIRERRKSTPPSSDRDWPTEATARLRKALIQQKKDKLRGQQKAGRKEQEKRIPTPPPFYWDRVKTENAQQETDRKAQEKRIPTPPPFNWDRVKTENAQQETDRKKQEKRIPTPPPFYWDRVKTENTQQETDRKAQEKRIPTPPPFYWDRVKTENAQQEIDRKEQEKRIPPPHPIIRKFYTARALTILRKIISKFHERQALALLRKNVEIGKTGAGNIKGRSFQLNLTPQYQFLKNTPNESGKTEMHPSPPFGHQRPLRKENKQQETERKEQEKTVYEQKQGEGEKNKKSLQDQCYALNLPPEESKVVLDRIDQLSHLQIPFEDIQKIISILPTLKTCLTQLEQKFEQQTELSHLLPSMMAEQVLDSQAIQERQIISQNVKLIEFNRTIRQQCNQYYLAAMAIHSGMVANNKKNMADHIMTGFSLLTDQLPGIGLIGQILKSGIQAIGTRNKNLEIHAFVQIASDPTEFAQLTETFARRLTIAKMNDLKKMDNTNFSDKGFNSCIAKGKRLIRELQKGEKITPIQAEAEIISEQIFVKTMARELPCQQTRLPLSPETVIQSWLEVILKSSYHYQSPSVFEAFPFISASIGPTSQQMNIMLNQPSIRPKSASVNETKEVTNELEELKKQLADQTREVETLKRQLAAQNNREQKLENQLRELIEHDQTREVGALKIQLTDQKKREQKLENQLRELSEHDQTREVEMLKRQLAAQNNREQKLENQLRELSEHDQTREVEMLKRQLAAQNDREQKLENQLRELIEHDQTREVEMLKRQLAAQNDREQKLENQLRELLEHDQAREKELQECKKEIKKLKEQMSDADITVGGNSVQSHISRGNDEPHKRSTQRYIQTQLKAHHDQLYHLTDNLVFTQEESKHATQKIVTLENRINQLERKKYRKQFRL